MVALGSAKVGGVYIYTPVDTSDIKPDVFAFFLEILGDVPQHPTTCFSNRLDIVPMWAHYALDSKGFCLEIDEEALLEAIPDCTLNDVSYTDDKDNFDLGLLHYAHMTTKPRHTYFLKTSAFHNAYFKKAPYWNYEEERRLVISDSDVSKVNYLMILGLPISCVTAIISGSRAEEKTLEACEEICRNLSLNHHQMIIGRSSLTPYFRNQNDKTFQFTTDCLEEVEVHCRSCGEPIQAEERKLCFWCSIDEEHKEDAAGRNPYRILHHAGLLDEYLDGMDKIGKK